MNGNNKSKTRGSASQKNGKSKTSQGKKSNPGPRQVRGAAEFRDNARTVGLADLRMHKVSWLCGYTTVGDGTTGATDSVYFRTIGSGNLVPGNSGGGQVPILGADDQVGQTYVDDIEKHYSRKIVRRARLRVESLLPSTSNSMMCCVAPVRGSGASGDTIAFTGATTAAPTIANTMGMQGAKSCPSYDRLELDLTPYIAGGSGAAQNEFTINRDGDTSGSSWGSGTIDLVGIAPCAFVVAGTSATAALRGQNVHMIVVDTWCDYLDFIGGNANPTPIGLAMTREEAAQVLRLILMGPDKEARNSRLCKALVKAVGSSSL